MGHNPYSLQGAMYSTGQFYFIQTERRYVAFVGE